MQDTITQLHIDLNWDGYSKGKKSEMLRLVVFFREGKVPWGKSDLGIWLRLLIREEKSGNKLSSSPSPQYTMGQSAARILLINPLAPTSYGAFIFV